MKRLLLVAFLVSVAAVSAANSAVRSKEIGLGIVLGEPSGLDGQFFMTKNSILDFTAAWSFEHSGGLFVAGDYQIYNNLADAPREWSWYYGIGGYLAFPEDRDGILGARVPLGIAYAFPNSSIDMWVEIDPALQLIPDTEADLMGGIGVTFWIK